MEKLANAVKLAIDKFEEEHGKLEVGNEFVTVFNNGILVISCEESVVSIHSVVGQPYTVDETLSIYESEE